MKKLITKILCLLIRFYRICISPFFPASCRFYPTCSSYALEAVQKHGPWNGFLLAVKRIVRCNPCCKGGYDPVP